MIEILTLGDFDIKIDDVSILESMGNQPKLMKLFKYFLTFQGKKLLPENIIEDIWDFEDFKDPLNVLRTQISRVRKMADIKESNSEPFFEINYVNGYYLFKLADNCRVDFMHIESFSDIHSPLKGKDEIMTTCKEGIKLYKGQYLSELGNEEWLIPVRSRFDRIYAKNLAKYLQMLKRESMDSYIVSICEEIIRYRPYEEIVHIYFIESLVKLGQNRYALNHYRYYTSKIYSEFKETPSMKMKNLYKTIKLKDNKTSRTLSLDSLDIELKDSDESQGALLCEDFYFKFLYNLELRNTERNRGNVFIGIITIDQIGYKQLSERCLKETMSLLLDVIYKRLRKGDVLTAWNESQVLLLLYGLEEENIESIINRIEYRFRELIEDINIILNIKLKKI